MDISTSAKRKSQRRANPLQTLRRSLVIDFSYRAFYGSPCVQCNHACKTPTKRAEKNHQVLATWRSFDHSGSRNCSETPFSDSSTGRSFAGMPAPLVGGIGSHISGVCETPVWAKRWPGRSSSSSSRKEVALEFWRQPSIIERW